MESINIHLLTSPFSGVCNVIWDWCLLYSVIQKLLDFCGVFVGFFVPFSKQSRVLEVLTKKTSALAT